MLNRFENLSSINTVLRIITAQILFGNAYNNPNLRKIVFYPYNISQGCVTCVIENHIPIGLL